jgi:hypothetical protein
MSEISQYMSQARMAQQSRMHDERLRFDVWRTVALVEPDYIIDDVYEQITGRPWVREQPEDETV